MSQLERKVGYRGCQIGVAGSLAVSVDASLNLRGALRTAGDGVGDGTAGVVVEVDADLAVERTPRISATICSTSCGREPPFVSQSTSASAPASAAARSTRRLKSRFDPVPVEEVLGIEEHPKVVFPQECNRLCRHRERLVERGPKRLGDVQLGCLRDDAHGFGVRP